MRRSTLCLLASIPVLGCMASEAPAAAAERVIYAFCSQQDCVDGSMPHAGLLAFNGLIYGTTDGGGDYYDSGTVFSIDPKTHAEFVLHSFGANDGQDPNAALTELGGMFYGTTTQGGDYGFGTVFSLDPSTGAETVLHSFDPYSQDSIYPVSGVVAVKGVLYGTTWQGGKHGLGDIYSVNLRTGKERVVYSFPGNNSDGYSAGGSLLNVKGALYGATSAGGDYRNGTVFSFDPKSGAELVLYSFCPQEGCADGESPSGALIEKDGTLYGTSAGGAYNNGAVFSIDIASGKETVLYSFCAQQSCADGSGPSAGLIEANGILYGATEGGGSNGDGTVFSLDPASGKENVLFSFNSLEESGYLPNGGLLRLGGKLYGTTYLGGTHASGVVFKIKP